MAIVGAYLRCDPQQLQQVRQTLEACPGASPFALDGAGQLGVLIEANDLKAAHAILRDQVGAVPGVYAAWPVYMNLEDEPDGPEPAEVPSPARAARRRDRRSP